MEKALKKLARIKNPEIRKLAAKMWFTMEVISRMEDYRKQHYGN